MNLRPSMAIAALVALNVTAARAVVVTRFPAHTIRLAGPAQHTYTGTLLRTQHTILTLKLRSGQRLRVDATAPARAGVVPRLSIGESLTTSGSLIAGVLFAASVAPASTASRLSPPDR